MPEHLQAIPFALAQRLNTQWPQVLEWEARAWSDGCFELEYPGGRPQAVAVEGYRLVLDFDGEIYIVRTDADATHYRIEAAPAADVAATILWSGNHRTDGGICLELLLDASGNGSIAGCGEPGTRFGLGESGIGSLEYLAYALEYGALGSATSTDVGDSRLEIRGDKAFNGTPSQLRGIEVWARYSAIESYAGHSGASFALAVAWHDSSRLPSH